VGCGRVGFEVVSVDAGGDVFDAGALDAGPSIDAAVDVDADRGDAALDGGLPDAGPPDGGPRPMFGPPTLVAELNTALGEVDLTLTGDELEIFFITRAVPGIWTATRPSLSSPWSAARQFTELLGEGDGDPEVSTDGLRMRFTSTRPGGAGSSDLWESTRPDRDSAWATSTPLVIAGSIPAIDDLFEQGNQLPRVRPLCVVVAFQRADRPSARLSVLP
jgi:hypothetical protein